MKKILLAGLCVLLFATAAMANSLVVGFVTGASGLGDLSYNDMAYGGIRKAQQEHGFKLIVTEPEGNGQVTKEAVLGAVKQADVVLVLGAQHIELVKELGKLNPNKKFVLFEIPVEGFPNISSVMFKQSEGSFMAGALAAMVTETGKVGFVGGTPIPPVQAFEQGYREGVAYANPKVDVMVDYVSPAGDFSGFGNPKKGYSLANGQYNKGADIVFAVAGLTGNGVIEAARRSGNYAIGVDSDQDSLAKGFVLTSMIKRLDTATYTELTEIVQDRFTAGPSYYGLNNGGVSLSEMKYTRDKIAPGVLEKLDAIKAKVIDGEIKVTDLLSAKK
ncbi:BMP family ABC transporter substrate-binding protein [Pseudodesulfovibrio sp. zrk46]|uniref:BMP family lipoprotein n=1 Tax=Pseudodesulfovibrio sp. zrk46 TaxID=2725288 RepID=UPI001449A67B|nr:BMP family ABC transporter substrate-binding protein [Pseudodesulfovibrio sp. zrk46]QJB55915.1 BMP family ABC transporter substrate-binding protein [Pseudodesulfovibrio sp. zrk46]